MRHFMLAPLRVRRLRAKLVERESAAIETAARLAENHSARRRDFDEGEGNEEQRADKDGRKHSQGDIGGAFCEHQGLVSGRGSEGQKRCMANSFQRQSAVDVREEVDRDPAADAFLIATKKDLSSRDGN
jgi:hypothetical protein